MLGLKQQDWKRWVAMLCIALVSFFVLQETSPAHAASDLKSSQLSIIEAAQTYSSSTSSDENSSPVSSAELAHHCCAAHGKTVTPIALDSDQFALVMESVPSLRRNESWPYTEPSNLERPPKAIFAI